MSYFLSWPCFISSVGRVSLPQLAETLSKETIFAWKNYCKLHKTDTPPVVVLCFENCQAIIIGKYNKNYRKWASTVPMWGKQLSHLGQAPCPKWARVVSKTVPKVFIERNVSKGMQSANITDSFLLMRNQKSILIDSQIYLFRVVVVVSPAFSRDTNQKMKHGLHGEPRIGLSRIFF